MAKKKDKVRPFSNGSEFMVFVQVNCDECEKFDPNEAGHCDLYDAMQDEDDGRISLEIAERVGFEVMKIGKRWTVTGEIPNCKEIRRPELLTHRVHLMLEEEPLTEYGNATISCDFATEREDGPTVVVENTVTEEMWVIQLSWLLTEAIERHGNVRTGTETTG